MFLPAYATYAVSMILFAMLAEWLTGPGWLAMQFMLAGSAGNAGYAVLLSWLDMFAVNAFYAG
jgi:hypothetical protein